MKMNNIQLKNLLINQVRDRGVCHFCMLEGNCGQHVKSECSDFVLLLNLDSPRKPRRSDYLDFFYTPSDSKVGKVEILAEQ